MKNSNKKRATIWLLPKTFDKMDKIISEENFKNRSEYMEQAIEFYADYLATKDSSSYLAQNVQSAIETTMKATEKRMANNLFRMSVEMGMMMRILAKGLEVTDESLRVLRGICVKDVKSCKGSVPFEKIIGEEK